MWHRSCSIESTTPAHLLAQFESAIREALASRLEVRARMRATSATWVSMILAQYCAVKSREGRNGRPWLHEDRSKAPPGNGLGEAD